MNLRDYIKARRGRAVELAGQIGVDPVLIRQWSTIRPVPVARCVAIEQATGGAVKRQDLRPDDWRQIWPELVQAKRGAKRRSVT